MRSYIVFVFGQLVLLYLSIHDYEANLTAKTYIKFLSLPTTMLNKENLNIKGNIKIDIYNYLRISSDFKMVVT